MPVMPGSLRNFNKFGALMEDDREEAPTEEMVINIRKVVGKDKDEPMRQQKPTNRKAKQWVDLGFGDIVVDSAADESCWPQGMGEAYPTKPSRKNILLKTANGSPMGHYGQKDILFQNAGDGQVVGLTFQVTDVKKPLLAVRRLTEKGNIVQFGADPGDSYIKNKVTGMVIPMERKGGSFVIKAKFVKEMMMGEPDFTRQVR